MQPDDSEADPSVDAGPSETSGRRYRVALDRQPSRNPAVAELRLGEELVIAHEGCHRPVLLDPVSAVLWDAFDGTTTVGELIDDLQAAIGGDDRRSEVDWLVTALSEDGFVQGGQPEEPVLPHVLHPWIDPDSCVGKHIGLGRAELVQVYDADQPVFRLGATVPGIVDELASCLPEDLRLGEVDDTWVETIVLRGSPGRRPRLQQLLDTMGDPLYVSRDLDEAVQALRRAAVALAAERRDRDAWFVCPALVTDAGVSLIHPGFRHAMTQNLRTSLQAAGARFAPCAALRLELVDGRQPELVAPGGPGAPELRWPLRRILMPATDTRGQRAQALVHLVRRWDQVHLDALAQVEQHAEIMEIEDLLDHDRSERSFVDAVLRP